MYQFSYTDNVLDSLNFKMKYWEKQIKSCCNDTPQYLIKLFEEQSDQLKRIIENLEKELDSGNMLFFVSADELDKIADADIF